MKTKYVAALVSSLLLAGIAAAQTSTNLNQFASILYDDFNQQLIDPLRWTTGASCWSSDYAEMECMRTIQAGKLLLAERTFGQRDSDTGNQVGLASLNFANPAAIKGVTADIVVRAIEEVPCAANPQFGGQIQINETFFNAGSGNPSDDVGAQLSFTHTVTDPKGEIFVWGQIFQGSNYFGFVPIGSISIGKPVTATLSWDKANHQFIAAATNDITHVKMQITLPYTFSDGTPATNAAKNFGAVNFPGNCTSNATWGYTEATFDNVRVSQ